MLWSMGKDSTVLLWLARKAFFGHVPFPLVHIDTGHEMPELIEYRDRLCREWRLDLVVGQNTEALAGGMGPQQGRVTCCTAMKIEALKPIHKSFLNSAAWRRSANLGICNFLMPPSPERTYPRHQDISLCGLQDEHRRTTFRATRVLAHAP